MRRQISARSSSIFLRRTTHLTQDMQSVFQSAPLAPIQDAVHRARDPRADLRLLVGQHAVQAGFFAGDQEVMMLSGTISKSASICQL